MKTPNHHIIMGCLRSVSRIGGTTYLHMYVLCTVHGVDVNAATCRADVNEAYHGDCGAPMGPKPDKLTFSRWVPQICRTSLIMRRRSGAGIEDKVAARAWYIELSMFLQSPCRQTVFSRSHESCYCT